MLTSKQRAYLRGLANPVPAIFQLGKGGINDNFIRQINDALEARELVKIHILENSGLDARQTCSELAQLCSAQPVQTIGSRFVIYRESKDNKTINLPKSR